MTVCVAAVAENERAIVLVADKALTYGADVYRPAMQADTGIVKMVELPGQRWTALFAGSASVAERVIQQAIARLTDDAEIGNSHDAMMDCFGQAYQETREQCVVEEILAPRLLTRESLVNRSQSLLPLPAEYFIDVAERIRKYHMQCDLLVCGFDAAGKACIFNVSSPGSVNSQKLTGYGAIGIGQETAISRLLWMGAAKDDELDVALYQALDAKRHAEMIQGVGYYSDVWVSCRL